MTLQHYWSNSGVLWTHPLFVHSNMARCCDLFLATNTAHVMCQLSFVFPFLLSFSLQDCLHLFDPPLFCCPGHVLGDTDSHSSSVGCWIYGAHNRDPTGVSWQMGNFLPRLKRQQRITAKIFAMIYSFAIEHFGLTKDIYQAIVRQIVN